MKKAKTLTYHKTVIKKACAALVKDGHDRNQAIGALIEFFRSDKSNPEFFNSLMDAYLAILKDDTIHCRDVSRNVFTPVFSSTKPLIDDIKRFRRMEKIARKTSDPMVELFGPEGVKRFHPYRRKK